jgi:hypothetical protein
VHNAAPPATGAGSNGYVSGRSSIGSIGGQPSPPLAQQQQSMKIFRAGMQIFCNPYEQVGGCLAGIV